MGMFPYTCKICGGGYVRCGNKDCDVYECQGGQFCWEDEVYFVDFVDTHNTYLQKGKYTGYGEIVEEKEKNNIKFVPIEFKGDVEDEDKIIVYVNVYCKSCVEKK